MRADWMTTQGDTGNPLRRVLYDASGAAIDLSDYAGVTFSLVRRGRPGVKVNRAPATVVDAGAGIVQYDGWTDEQLGEPGWFLGTFELTDGEGRTVTVPTGSLVIWIEPKRL